MSVKKKTNCGGKMAKSGDEQVNYCLIRVAWMVMDPDGKLLAGPFPGDRGHERAREWARRCTKYVSQERQIRHGG